MTLLAEHPIIFIFGCLFILFELFQFLTARAVATDLAYIKETPWPIKNPPSRIMTRGYIGIVYTIWSVCCVFVPPFTTIGLAILALSLIKGVVKTTKKKTLTMVVRLDALASMVILIAGLFYLN